MGTEADTPPRINRREDEISYAQFRALANSMPNLAWMANPDGWIIWYNQRWYDYTGTTPEEMEGWGWQAVHHPDVLPAMLENWTRALRTGEPFEMVFPLRRGSDGSYRTFVTRAEPLRENGAIVGWFGTNTDITEHERTRERLQLVINELNHRVKNTLATVQSIASSSFRASDQDAYDVFEGRLLALAALHDLLAKDGWVPVSLNDLVRQVVTSFNSGQVVVIGEPIPVDARLSSGLTMTLHELCTNAVKYGALSTPEGGVTIRWSIDDRDTLSLEWLERGGPPVETPKSFGFGAKLIRRALSAGEGASVDLAFEPEGVRCTIQIPHKPGGAP